MIKTKEDLCRYLEATAKAYHKEKETNILQRVRNIVFPDGNYEYMRTLRKYEYHYNNRGGGVHRLLVWYYAIMLSRWRYRTGIELGPNVADAGLHISHGKIVVSAQAKLGKNCKILSDVTIGGQGRYDRPGAARIGNRVFIGSGARIIGPVTIADDVVIGANAVVVNDILEPGITVGGIPAKKISNHNSYPYLNKKI